MCKQLDGIITRKYEYLISNMFITFRNENMLLLLS